MASKALTKGKEISHLKSQFQDSLLEIWRKNSNARIGLAISGGVDSMALATLCQNLQQTQPHRFSFLTFIVDHSARPNSALEARAVATELQKLKLRTRILKLDWTPYGGDVSSVEHFESAARDLRYRALGQACYAEGIRSLLVAHHSDDQAEGVLLRIVGRYLGAGLSGVKAEARIPSTMGMYGVCSSGSPLARMRASPGHGGGGGMLIEDGGVKICRPLLPFTKVQLIEICERAGTRWFEDATNADRSLTARNTVRYLLGEDVLPVALRRERMLDMAEKTLRKNLETKDAAEEAFERMKIQLDLRVGRVRFTINDPLPVSSPERDYRIQAALLRRLIVLASPKDKISPSDLHSAISFVFDEDPASSDTSSSVTVADTAIRRAKGYGPNSFVIERNPPYRYEAGQALTVHRHSPNPEWQLWDNRYWIRISPAESDLQVGVRFLKQEDIAATRQHLSFRQRQYFDQALSMAYDKLRFTVPAIFTETTEGDAVERLVALPSLNWSAESWKRWPDTDRRKDSYSFWDIRYKNVDLKRSDLHQIIDSVPKGAVAKVS